MNLNEYNYFLYLVQKCRICYIGGAFVGKTALAIKLAQDLCKEGYRLWANIDVKGTDQLDRIFALDSAERSCVILECAGLDLSDKRHAQAFLEHVLSRHIIVLMPSSVPPQDLLRILECYVGRIRPRWYMRCLPKQWQPQGLVCHWRIPGATYRGSRGKFQWQSPEEVYGLYNPRDPGSRMYMEGYSAYVWQKTLEQAMHETEGSITTDDLEILNRPGQIFMMCLWLHSQLVYLLALKQASDQERDRFRHNAGYQGSIQDQQVELQRENLGLVVKEFLRVFDNELQCDDLHHLEKFMFIRNSLAHCFFSLHHLDDQSGFVSYASNRQRDRDRIWILSMDETAMKLHIQEFLKLGECFHRLCRNMNIEYDRIL